MPDGAVPDFNPYFQTMRVLPLITHFISFYEARLRRTKAANQTMKWVLSLMMGVAFSIPVTTAHLPSQEPLSVTRTVDGCHLNWVGQNGIIYFVQYSSDLKTWSYMPVIERGADTPLHYDFPSDEAKVFVRLHYTNVATADPNNDDFDGDGISNWDEVKNGGTATDPLKWDTDGDGQSDYFADRDNNTVADGWELKHYGSVGTVDPAEDADGDGVSNSEESYLDTDPNAHADTNDEDGDGLVDSNDAVPDDALINWPPTPKEGYVYFELESISDMAGVTAVALGESGHVLVKVWPQGSAKNLPNMLNFVWMPETGEWSGPLQKTYNGTVGDRLSATDIDSNGKIVGKAWVVNLDGDGNASHVYQSSCEWDSVTAPPQPAAGSRLAVSGENTNPEADIAVIAPAFAPDDELLVMPNGHVYGAEEVPASLIHFHDDDLEKYWDPLGELPDTLSVQHIFGVPGLGKIVPMTKWEQYYDPESEEYGYRIEATYLYNNGQKQVITSDGSDVRAVNRMPDTQGDVGLGRIAVTGDHTWIYNNGVWAKTKRPVSGQRITSKGMIAQFGTIWMNGKFFTLEELVPEIAHKNYASLSIVDVNDAGALLVQAVDGDGNKKVGIAVPITFKEFAPNTGFDHYERYLKEQNLERPWLTVPDTNKVKMLRKPAHMKLALSTQFADGKNGSVAPTESQQSPEILTITGSGPWAQDENGYEGTLQVQQVDALNLVVYKKRSLTLAVHAITLINDDVDSGIALGNGKPNTICIRKGEGQGILWTSQTGGDDVLDFNGINTGANGICETEKTDPRDEQVIPMGKGEPHAVIVQPGPNGILNTAANGSGMQNVSRDEDGNILEVHDDDTVVGETITTGADGIRETPLVKAAQAPVNVPTKAQLQEKLDKVFSKQANIDFEVQYVNHVNIAYDVGDQAGEHPHHVAMQHPNGKFDYFTGNKQGATGLSPEEELVRAMAYDENADFNLYYFGSKISGFIYLFNISKQSVPVGFARSSFKTPYVRAYDPDRPIQNQDSAAVLSGIGVHELAHNDLFKPKTGLDHPRKIVEVNGVNKYVPDDPQEYLYT